MASDSSKAEKAHKQHRSHHCCAKCYFWRDKPIQYYGRGTCHLGPDIRYKDGENFCAQWACPWCNRDWRDYHLNCGPNMDGGSGVTGF